MTFLSFRSTGEFLVFVTALLSGITMIIGPNAVFSAPSFMKDYYKYLHNDPNAKAQFPTFWANVLTYYGVVTQVVQTIVEPTNLTRYARRFSLLFRLEITSILMIIEFLLLMIMPYTNTSEKAAVAGVVVAAFIGGVGRAFFENTTFALFGPCPSKHVSAVMIGISLSGCIMSAVQLILMGTMATDYEALRKQSLIYFSFSMGLIFCCFWLLLAMLFNSYARRYIAEFRSQDSVWSNIYRRVKDNDTDSEAGDRHDLPRLTGDTLENKEPCSEGQANEACGPHLTALMCNGEEQGAMNPMSLQKGTDDAAKQAVEAALEPTTVLIQKVKLWTVVKKVWPMMLTCLLTYFVTYIMYPGVLVAVDRSDRWFSTVLVAVYHYADICGRCMTLWRRCWPSRRVVTIVAFVRIAFIPLFVLCAAKIIPTHAVVYVLAILLAASTGFFGSLTMIYTPTTPSLSSEGERVLAEQLSGVCLMVGVSFGALLQVAVVKAF